MQRWFVCPIGSALAVGAGTWPFEMRPQIPFNFNSLRREVWFLSWHGFWNGTRVQYSWHMWNPQYTCVFFFFLILLFLGIIHLLLGHYHYQPQVASPTRVGPKIVEYLDPLRILWEKAPETRRWALFQELRSWKIRTLCQISNTIKVGPQSSIKNTWSTYKNHREWNYAVYKLLICLINNYSGLLFCFTVYLIHVPNK